MILSISQLKLLFLKFNNILSARERERVIVIFDFLGGGWGGEVGGIIDQYKAVEKCVKRT